MYKVYQIKLSEAVYDFVNGPEGGHTETVDASEIDLSTIWAKVEEISKVKE